METLKKLKAGEIKKVYLFYGEEKYKKKIYKDSLKKFIPYGNAMNYSYFEGKNIDLKAVYDSAMALPFFAEKRLVIVENSGKFKAKKKKNAEDEGAVNDDNEDIDDPKDIILEIINEMPDTTCLVFFEDQILKTKKEVKLISKEGVIEECAPDTPADIAKWIAKGFKSYGKAVEKDACMLLIERAGTDYTALVNEIEKIASYTGDKDVVTKDDVNAISVSNIETKIFDMLSYMSEKKPKAVMDKYYDMLAVKEEPRMIMAMIRRQFRIMLHVAELSERGYSEKDIASMTGNHPFVVKKMTSYIRNSYDAKSIIAVLDLINDIDMQTKNGNLEDRLGVELLLVEASK